MAQASIGLTAQNYGYISPRMRGRVDLDFYKQSLDYLLNYIVTLQGEVNYRTGSIFVSSTRNNNKARLIPFIYNTEQAYVIEMTDLYLRFYKDHGLITETPKAITAITKAAAAQVTIAGHGFVIGDPIYFDGVLGMHQINGREGTVASVVDANNFTVNINTTTYSTYTAGGTGAKIVQVASPYTEAQLFELDYTQTNDTMYIAHKSYAPYKLTRSSHTSWTHGTYTITSNPFGTTKAATKTITGITKANPAVVTSAAHGYANGDVVYIEAVVGMTEINKKTFTVQNVAANTFELKDYDSTLNTAYSSGGTAAKFTAFSYPSRVTLYDQRLVFAASDAFPTKLWFSEANSAAGKLDSFILGTSATSALEFNIASDQANRILWMVGAETYMAVGTPGSEYRVSGGSADEAITPTNVSVKPTSFNGVADIRPLRLDSYVLFAQRNKKTVRSYEYDALRDGYTSPDRTLLADHIGKSGLKQFSYTAGTPNIIWAIRNDGRMLGLTFDPAQQVVAWHPHKTNGSYLSAATIPEADGDDELWTCVERTVGGVTKRYIEYTPNVPEIPVFEDYFTGEDNKETDETEWLTDLWNVQRTMIYSDCALTYDGRDAATVGLTITGSLTTGSAVTVTASAAFFTSQMATDRRRIQTPDGGQIEITGFTSSTVVTGNVLYDLEASSFAIGSWYYMARSITGLSHLEGLTVKVLADGGTTPDPTVSSGSITLDEDAGYVIIGLGYKGIGKTQSIEGGSQQGIAQTKPRIIDMLGVQMRASLGTKFGTSLYDMEAPPYREVEEVAGRPPRLLDSAIDVPIPDNWDDNKNLFWLHDTPTPSNIQLLVIQTEVKD